MDYLYDYNNSCSRWENSFKANAHHFEIIYQGILGDVNSSTCIQKCAYMLQKA